MAKRKQHTQQFKENTVRYYNNHKDIGISVCAKNLNISNTILSNWIKASQNNNGAVSTRGSGNYSSDIENEIQDLFEKKLALENLIKVVDMNNFELYEKIIKDYGKTLREFQNWWDVNSKQNNWEGKNWFVDFGNKRVLCK